MSQVLFQESLDFTDVSNKVFVCAALGVGVFCGACDKMAA